MSVLRQICNHLPNHLVPRLARETGVQQKARTFSPWSHVVTMLFSQLTHAVSLNDVCDGLQLHSGPLSAVRGATPPSRNNLSHANRVRSAAFAEALFWRTLAHLQAQSPSFAKGRRHRFTRRFRATIHVVDATTISLIAHCMDWARHRRRKAAAKCHLRMDLQSMLPRFLLISAGKGHEVRDAPVVCADIKAGEIVVFDRAYVDFKFLGNLTGRGVNWVTRTKAKMAFRVVKKRLAKPQGKILRDDEIVLTSPASKAAYPQRMRRVRALVEVDGKEREMEFLTNHFEWAASSGADLYRSRWPIEVFFQQIKQTLQLADFLGNRENAVRWQLWTALLCSVLLRDQGHQSQWRSSFIRLWAVIRSTLWTQRDLREMLDRYGTAEAPWRCLAQPETLWLPGFRPKAVG